MYTKLGACVWALAREALCWWMLRWMGPCTCNDMEVALGMLWTNSVTTYMLHGAFPVAVIPAQLSK